jgi:hypothetical protein
MIAAETDPAIHDYTLLFWWTFWYRRMTVFA